MAVHTWTVEEVCAGVFAAIEALFPDEFWVRGEIQGLRKSPAGHLYFDLIEPGAVGRGQDAKLGTVAFRGPLRGIEAVLRKVGNLQLTDGLEVRVRGKVDFYPPQGRVQFIMSAIDPRHTLGQLSADRDRVMTALAAEGLLERNGALPMPLVPLRVGLVTSDDSAAYNDFVHELENSPFAFQIVFADARVQGVDAEPTLVAAINSLRHHALDVIAVVRGGGAKGDLLAFDREAVARAVAGCDVPVVVGIGHEIDRSIVDEVAHTTLKTPTACASALIDRVAGFAQRLTTIATATRHHGERTLRIRHDGLEACASRLGRATRATLAINDIHLDRQRDGLVRSATTLLDEAQSRVGRVEARLPAVASRILRDHDARLESAASLVNAVHPARTLARGYSITRTAGSIVGSVAAVTPGATTITEVLDGSFTSVVEAIDHPTEQGPTTDV